MTEAAGVMRGGRVELAAPAPWPDGAAVRVVLVAAADADDAPFPPEVEARQRAEQARVGAAPSGGMTEAEQVGSPEAIAAWLAWDEARPGMSDEDYAAWQRDWAEYRALTRSRPEAYPDGKVPS